MRGMKVYSYSSEIARFMPAFSIQYRVCNQIGSVHTVLCTGKIIPGQVEFGKWHPGSGQEYRQTFFYSVGAELFPSEVNFQSIRTFLANVYPS